MSDAEKAMRAMGQTHTIEHILHNSETSRNWPRYFINMYIERWCRDHVAIYNTDVVAAMKRGSHD